MKRAAFVLAVMLLYPALLPAQELSSAAELRKLVEEVRAIRVSMQRLSAADLRGRILLQQLAMQQQIVKELSSQVEGSKMDMGMNQDFEGFDQMTSNLDEKIKKEINPEARRQLERERDGAQRRKEAQVRGREQWRIRMQRVEIRTAEEQDRLKTLEKELALLVKELAAPPAVSPGN